MDEATSLFEAAELPKPKLAATIKIPFLTPMPFGHSRDQVRARAKALNQIELQLTRVRVWLTKERKYVQDSCLGHFFDRGRCGDCGIGQR